jgi:hypothetical protein
MVILGDATQIESSLGIPGELTVVAITFIFTKKEKKIIIML